MLQIFTQSYFNPVFSKKLKQTQLVKQGPPVLVKKETKNIQTFNHLSLMSAQ